VTANNAVVGEDYPYLISLVYDHGHRARRIVDLIENAPGPIDVNYVQRMQGDNMDLNAQKLVPYLLGSPVDPTLEPARQLLEGWDFQAHMDSPAAALFATFWRNLLARTFHDELPEDVWPAGDSRWFVVIADLVDRPENAWWDDKGTPQVETRDEIFNQALAAAVAELEELLGNDPADWTWGDLHTLTLTNQTLGTSGISQLEAIFNRGKFRASGGSGIVNATGWKATESYEVRSLPSMRMIVDLSDLSRALMIHTSGQSGHAYHRHYVDMADLWRNIEYLPMLWAREQVEATAEGLLRLVP